MNRAPSVVVVAAAYLCLGSLVLYVWLSHTEPALPGYAALVCALPLALLLLVTSKPTLPARARIVRSLACFMFLPFLLFMWGLSADFAPAPAPPVQGPPPETLTSELLFQGAVARQEVPQVAGMTFRASAAVFADDSELRVSRFASGAEAEAQLALLRETFHASPTTLGVHTGMSAQLATNQLLYWELHGASVLELRAGDLALLRARLDAQNVPPAPPARAVARQSEHEAKRPSATWFALGAALAHALLFCLFVFWSAAATTRVAAPPGSTRLSQASLLARVDALPELGARCRVEPGADTHERVIALLVESMPGRAQELTVRCDEPGRVVRVIERESALGVTPRSSDEASMRAPGDASFAPSRPRAQRVWSMKRQTTFIEPERLRNLPLSFDGDAARLPAGFAETLDGDGILHLLCALVTSAGFDYQPVLLLFHGGPAAKP